MGANRTWQLPPRALLRLDTILWYDKEQKKRERQVTMRKEPSLWEQHLTL